MNVTKIKEIIVAYDEFLKDASLYDIASCYMKLYDQGFNIYRGEYIDDDGNHWVYINLNNNTCSIDDEMSNAEQLIHLFDDNEDVIKTIEGICGSDIYDYITDIVDENLSWHKVNIFNKKYFLGDWKSIESEQLSNKDKEAILNKLNKENTDNEYCF